MQSQRKQKQVFRPCTVASARAEAHAAFEKLLEFCQQSEVSFWVFVSWTPKTGQPNKLLLAVHEGGKHGQTTEVVWSDV